MDHLLHVIMVLAALAAFFVAPLPMAVFVSAVVAGASLALFIAVRRARIPRTARRASARGLVAGATHRLDLRRM